MPGHIYLLTTATWKRKPVFGNPETVGIVLDSLKYLESHGVINLEAAVVMPDHVHFVAGLLSGTLGELMQRFKSFTAKEINKIFKGNGPV